jgi:hypothetical protein
MIDAVVRAAAALAAAVAAASVVAAMTAMADMSVAIVGPVFEGVCPSHPKSPESHPNHRLACDNVAGRRVIPQPSAKSAESTGNAGSSAC